MILTEDQQGVVDADGNFLLLACPGSGKTRAAAARVARLASTGGAKVAVCSYTNVGAARLSAMIGAPLAAQHFLGTLHGFLLRYVVYPFAHLAGASRGPEIRTGEWPTLMVHGDPKQRLALDDLRFSANGDLVLCAKPRSVKGTPEEILASVREQVRARKGGYFKKAGVVSADDSMWVALRLLGEHPSLALAVARRFDEILVDEAQDTAELQLACVTELVKTGGLESLVMIGDLEQSIFSFQGASAEGCRKLAGDHGLREISLAENHRCSQKICNVAAHFCTRAEPDTAVGPDRDCEIDPEVALYPAADPERALDTFRARLDAHGIRPAAAAVLARRHAMVDALTGETNKVDIQERPKRVARIAVALAEGTLTRADVRFAEQCILHCACGDDVELEDLDNQQRGEVRAAASRFLSGLPEVRGDLRDWIKRAKEALQESACRLVTEPKTAAGRLIKSGGRHEGVAIEEVFTPPPRDLVPRTVHSIKGEDRDAVMMVVRKPHGADPTRQLELFHAVASGGEVEEGAEEERRVTFVALTRARRYCLVAVPDTSRGRDVARACLDLGFVSV
jgi:DNA helicase II / ATP-dependent DNA helicase PcrA